MTETAQNDFLILVSDLASVWGITSQGAHKYLKEKGFEITLITGRAYLLPRVAREAMLSRGFVYKPTRISLQMLKGGVAKTTTAMNIGIRANMYGARVLLIDLDQQANLSFAFGIEDSKAPVWTDIVEGKRKITETIIELSDGFHIIPSNLNNSVLDRVLLSGKINIATAVGQHLEKIKTKYDLILLDTSPNLSAINTAAACAADMVILPVNPDKFSFDGLKKTLADLKNVRKEFGASFIEKLLFTKFDGRETSSHELLKLCFAHYSNMMLKGFIRTSSEMKNTIRSGTNVFIHKTTAKEDYDIVTREIMELSR